MDSWGRGRYRRDERVSWKIQPRDGTFPMHPGTNNSRWQRRRRSRRLSRNTCGSPAAVPTAVKYWEEAREHRHVVLRMRHPILFMSEYSKTPTLPSPSLVTLSSCVPRRPLTVPSNVRLSLWTCQNARNCQCTCASVQRDPFTTRLRRRRNDKIGRTF